MPLAIMLLAAMLLLPAGVAAQADDLWSLYSLAISRDPAIGRATAQFQMSRSDEDRALSYLLPRADASAGVNWITNTTVNYDPSGDIHGGFTGYNYGAGARLPLLNMPGIFNLFATKAASRSSEAAISATRQDLITRLCEAYFGILKAKADERLYRDELKRLAQIQEQAQAFLKAGVGDIIAVYEAKARMDSAAADMVRAESQRRLAEQQLSGLVGREVTEVKDLGAIEPQGPVPSDLGWWLETMQQHQPAIIQARESLLQTGEQRKAAKAGHLPTIQASGGYSVSKGSTFLPEVETRQWYAGFSISVPLYSGGETMARTRRAVAEESEQRFILQDVQEQRVQKLKEAFLNLQYNTAIISSVRQKKASAEVQLAGVKKGRSIGTRTAIDLLNSEQSYAISQRDLTSALYDNALRQLQLKGAAGILGEEDLKSLNQALVEVPVKEAGSESGANPKATTP